MESSLQYALDLWAFELPAIVLVLVGAVLLPRTKKSQPPSRR